MNVLIAYKLNEKARILYTMHDGLIFNIQQQTRAGTQYPVAAAKSTSAYSLYDVHHHQNRLRLYFDSQSHSNSKNVCIKRGSKPSCMRTFYFFLLPFKHEPDEYFSIVIHWYRKYVLDDADSFSVLAAFEHMADFFFLSFVSLLFLFFKAELDLNGCRVCR